VGGFSQINPEDQRWKTCDSLVVRRIFRPPRKGGPVFSGAMQDDGAKLCSKRGAVFQTC